MLALLAMPSMLALPALPVMLVMPVFGAENGANIKKNRFKKAIDFMMIFGHTFSSIFMDFGLHLGFHFSSKITPNGETELKGPLRFLNFYLYRVPEVPHVPDFDYLGPCLGRFFDEN